MSDETDDFEKWRDEVLDESKSPENVLVRVEAALMAAGWSMLPEAVPCAFCGEPCGCRDPDGLVRHPRCPMTEAEMARMAKAKAREQSLRSELEQHRRIREHLNRQWGKEPG